MGIFFKGTADEWADAGCPRVSHHQAEAFLRQAVMDDHRSMTRLVLEQTDWILSEDMDQGPGNPARLALELGHERCLQAFLDHADCAQWPFEHRQTLLHLAVEGNLEWALEPLLLAGAPLDAPNAAGLTPVALAAHKGRPRMLALLLESAKERGESFENSRQPAWQIEANPSALTIALTALASATQQLSSQSELDFIRQSCLMLANAGSSPNEPCGALAVMSRRFAGAFTCSQASMEAALSFALGLGARWDAPGLEGLTALEVAGARLDETLADCLLRLGAPLSPQRSVLAAPAWSDALESGRDIGPAQVKTLARWCGMESFWPPMASSEEGIKAYFAKLPRLPRQHLLAEKERLAIFSQTLVAAASAAPKAPSPRL